MRTTAQHLLRAGLVVAALAPAVALAQQPGDAARMAAAQQRFDRGFELFDRQDFATAISEFRASLELAPSPNTRLYVGLCLLRTGALAEAHAELQRTFTEARDRALSDPRYANARNIAERELEALRPRLGRLVVRADGAPAGATLRAGSVEVAAAMLGLPLYFDPGEVAVTGEAPGRAPFRQTVRLTPDVTTEVSVTFDRATAAPLRVQAPNLARTEAPRRMPVERVTGGGVRTAGYVVGGLGVLGVGSFALFGLFAGQRFDEVSLACQRRSCPSRAWEASIDEGEAWQLAANVSLGVGVGLVVTGAIMIAVGGPRVTVEQQEERRTARIAPYIDAVGRTLGVQGAF
jgi:hypothetical protein